MQMSVTWLRMAVGLPVEGISAVAVVVVSSVSLVVGRGFPVVPSLAVQRTDVRE